jgi:hypothetical protein
MSKIVIYGKKHFAPLVEQVVCELEQNGHQVINTPDVSSAQIAAVREKVDCIIMLAPCTEEAIAEVNVLIERRILNLLPRLMILSNDPALLKTKTGAQEEGFPAGVKFSHIQMSVPS